MAEGRPFLKESHKTAAGYRSIDIPTRIMALIEAHLERYVGPQPEAWLYGNGRPISPRHFYRAWEEARKKVALKMTLHDLRHSGLTWSARTGAPLAELMRRGDHSDPKASIRYQHATRETGRALPDKLTRGHNIPDPPPVITLAAHYGAGTRCDARAPTRR